MRAVWGEENRFRAIAMAEVAHGMIPREDAETIAASASDARLERAKEIEAEIDHDMMAIVRALSEVCGDAGRWIHYGATSNDILDTATALQNNVLWDERDLTNSSTERVLSPEASVLADHILRVMIDVVDGLEFNKEKIRKNQTVETAQDVPKSQRLPVIGRR